MHTQHEIICISANDDKFKKLTKYGFSFHKEQKVTKI